MKLIWVPMFLAAGVACLASDAVVEPRYSGGTPVDVRGTVTAVYSVPPGKAMAGVHATIKTKTETLDVFLAPHDFLSLLKMSVAVGDELRIIGARVNGDTILTKEFSKKGTSIVLRDPDGSPVWQNWGVPAEQPITG